MTTLTINDAPTRDLDRDVLHVWADVPEGGRYPISVSRKYLLDVWGAEWRDAVAAFEARKEEVRAAAEAAYLAKRPKFELFVDPTA